MKDMRLRQSNVTLILVIFAIFSTAMAAKADWIQSTDQVYVKRDGLWRETSIRYAEKDCLQTCTNGSSLTFVFNGTDLVLRLAQHAVPAYGYPNLGKLTVHLDDNTEQTIYPIAEPREVVIAHNLPLGKHTLKIEHLTSAKELSSIEAFGYSSEPTGELTFTLMGENNTYLVDARAVLSQGDRLVANRLVRNWLTGQCRLALLPPGEDYRLELKAIGWKSQVIDGIVIKPNCETLLPPIYMATDPDINATGFLFPRIGQQVIRIPGESFRARFQAFSAKIVGVYIERTVGPARITRVLDFKEDQDSSFYYDREITVKTPNATPPGLYDLKVKVSWPKVKYEYELKSPRAVMIVDKYPRNPVFISWGHLDTQGQYQAEYFRSLVDIANLIGADMLMVANACNPVYIAGAMTELNIPHVINFGNHAFPGFEKWFGPDEGIIDLGPDICILNRSAPWHESTAKVDTLLSARSNASIKIINAFEHNAPVDLLNRHSIALIHEAHGPGERVMEIGSTPTLRVGKSNSESFRVIRFSDGRVASCTYMGHRTAPIPFQREAIPPLRLTIDPPADGTQTEVRVTITNDLQETFPDCRVTIVMPSDNYICSGGKIRNSAVSDCGQFILLTLQTDAKAKSTTIMKVMKKARTE
jgi:hypothetical protein